LTYEDILESKSANCVIVGTITVREDIGGDIKFLGEIQNTGEATARFVKIVFTMKNTGGNVIGTDYTYVNSIDLSPGQTSSFECWTKTPYIQVSSWTHEKTWDSLTPHRNPARHSVDKITQSNIRTPPSM